MITMKDIIREGDPRLREISSEVSLPPSAEDIHLANSLLEYVINSQNPEIAAEYGLRSGIGLAAPQIGILKRAIGVHVTDLQGNLYSYALLNPKIVSHSVEEVYLSGGEGCLSVDRDVPGYVPRYARITVTGFDTRLGEVKIRLKGLPAICFQHEIDHLNGVMFYDRINKTNPFSPPEGASPLERK
ncbi:MULTISPECIES: peptide deformylase [Bacillaceae]|uniref:Peptide deformylase n=1 Tax=Gottfriedia luciferensis TaxID=178774 RepID=A0ABX2ZMN9_9BACI|nr:MULTISPECIES: peptide deformylase [Bacillaceae]ODG89772.1 peptide deformylase [Gottfriedia luciferensis]PGZ91452.1 peptide deformylase [Bacillus sp. AFS029533]